MGTVNVYDLMDLPRVRELAKTIMTKDPDKELGIVVFDRTSKLGDAMYEKFVSDKTKVRMGGDRRIAIGIPETEMRTILERVLGLGTLIPSVRGSLARRFFCPILAFGHAPEDGSVGVGVGIVDNA